MREVLSCMKAAGAAATTPRSALRGLPPPPLFRVPAGATAQHASHALVIGHAGAQRAARGLIRASSVAAAHTHACSSSRQHRGVPLHRERILLLAVSSVFGRIGTTSGVMLGTLVDARLCSFVPTPLTGRPCAGRST